jgi:hypothetical protein
MTVKNACEPLCICGKITYPANLPNAGRLKYIGTVTLSPLGESKEWGKNLVNLCDFVAKDKETHPFTPPSRGL